MIEITPTQAKLYELIGDEPVTMSDIRRLWKTYLPPKQIVYTLLKAGLLECLGVAMVRTHLIEGRAKFVKAKQYKKVIKPYRVREPKNRKKRNV